MSTNPRPPFEAIGRRCYWSREMLEGVPAAIAAAAELLVEEAAWLPSHQGDFNAPMDHRRFCAVLRCAPWRAKRGRVVPVYGLLPFCKARWLA
jgi:hypothetical protein